MGVEHQVEKETELKPAMEKVLVILVFSYQIMVTSSQILGAGTGIGSCRAAPFRSSNVNWDVCPPSTACCSEYGYCRTREEWKQLKFRDCNGISNGISASWLSEYWRISHGLGRSQLPKLSLLLVESI